MGDSIFNDKATTLLARIGLNVREQRIKVFRDNEQRFAERVSSAAGHPVTTEEILAIENGNPDVKTISLMRVLVLMQVGEPVADATKSNASLFLAASKRFSGLEDEIRRNTPR